MSRRFKMNGKIFDWDDELIKIARLNLKMALRRADPEDRESLISLAVKTLKCVGDVA